MTQLFCIFKEKNKTKVKFHIISSCFPFVLQCLRDNQLLIRHSSTLIPFAYLFQFILIDKRYACMGRALNMEFWPRSNQDLYAILAELALAN